MCYPNLIRKVAVKIFNAEQRLRHARLMNASEKAAEEYHLADAELTRMQVLMQRLKRGEPPAYSGRPGDRNYKEYWEIE